MLCVRMGVYVIVYVCDVVGVFVGGCVCIGVSVCWHIGVCVHSCKDVVM